MFMGITIVLLIVFAACVAMLWQEGIWSNAIRLVNLLTAAMLATSYWEPLADLGETTLPSGGTYTYWWDYIALWSIFVASYLLLNAITDRLSRRRVRFLGVVNRYGSMVLAVWIGWVMVCFTAMTLHTAPLPRTFLGFYPEPESRIFFGLAPDHRWLAFAHKLSRGALSNPAPEGEPGEVNTFDPQAEFILRYGERRYRFEQQPSARVPRSQ